VKGYTLYRSVDVATKTTVTYTGDSSKDSNETTNGKKVFIFAVDQPAEKDDNGNPITTVEYKDKANQPAEKGESVVNTDGTVTFTNEVEDKTVGKVTKTVITYSAYKYAVLVNAPDSSGSNTDRSSLIPADKWVSLPGTSDTQPKPITITVTTLNNNKQNYRISWTRDKPNDSENYTLYRQMKVTKKLNGSVDYADREEIKVIAVLLAVKDGDGNAIPGRYDDKELEELKTKGEYTFTEVKYGLLKDAENFTMKNASSFVTSWVEPIPYDGSGDENDKSFRDEAAKYGGVWAVPALPTISSIRLRDKMLNGAIEDDKIFSPTSSGTPTAYIENTEIVIGNLKPPYKYTFTINAISPRPVEGESGPPYEKVVLLEKSVTPGFDGSHFTYTYAPTLDGEDHTINFGCNDNPTKGDIKNGSVKNPAAWSEFDTDANVEIELIVSYDIVEGFGSLIYSVVPPTGVVKLPISQQDLPATANSVWGKKLQANPQ
jgi:hypothetical protein